MFEGHDPYLVALSVVIAILGGYTGFGLAARIRGTPGVSRRLLLAGAAAFLAVGIWTMHFVGMLAAPIPADTVYLVLPTIVSFLICALVVGVSLFFVSIGEPSLRRVASAAVLLGAGIASMHYVGIHGLAGNFAIQHDTPMVLLSILIAIVTAYGGLRAFLARQDGVRLLISAVAFGVAVSGMHYTAMYGMHFVPLSEDGACAYRRAGGIAANAVAGGGAAVLRDRGRLSAVAGAGSAAADSGGRSGPSPIAGTGFAAQTACRTGPGGGAVAAAALGAIGRPRPAAPRSAGAAAAGRGRRRHPFHRHSADVRSVRADAHYTRVHDGTRERMCPWSISEAEAQLDPGLFVRVHRSHIVAIPHVSFVRKEGDGAVIELDGPSPHRVPVSRAKIAEVKARLGLRRGVQTH